MRLFLMLAVLSYGCKSGETDEPVEDTDETDTDTDADTDSDTDADTDADTDSDTDADTDTDTDTDSDTDTDTGIPDTDVVDPDTDTGVVDTDVVGPDTDTGVVDTGVIGPDTDTGVVDTGVEPCTSGVRDGTYEGDLVIDAVCETFTGTLTDTCTGTMTIVVDECGSPQIVGAGDCVMEDFAYEGSGALEGNISIDPDADGTIVVNVDGTDYEEPWTGVFDGDTFDGAFSGTLTVASGLVSCDYEGTFTTTR